MAVLMAVEVVLLFLMVGLVTLVDMGVLSKDVLISIDKTTGMPNDTTALVIMLWFLIFVALMMAIKMLRHAFMVGIPSKLKSYGNSFDQ